MSQKTGLGRGLGALLSNNKKSVVAEEAKAAPSFANDRVASEVVASQPAPALPAEEGTMIRQVTLEKIQANPNQPRKNFEPHRLEELMSSIKEHGILQPLVVTPANAEGKYTIIAGERRFRASQMVGLKKVPVIVREVKDQEALELAIVENIQRADLNPIEEARAYRRLMDEFNLTQDQVGVRVGKSRPGVANLLRLLDLPEAVQKAILDEKISAGHAKVLGSLERPADQEAYLKRILEHKLTVRELEEQTQAARKPAKPRAQKFDPVREAQEELLRERFGTKTQIKKSGDKGQILIHFYSAEEFKRLMQELT